MVWNSFAIYSKSNIQNFLFLYISLAVRRNFRNWHQLLYSRSGPYKIYALYFALLWCNLDKEFQSLLNFCPPFCLWELTVGAVNHFQFHRSALNYTFLHWFGINWYFSNKWYNFHIDQIKGKLVKRQLKMLHMVQKTVSNHLKGLYISSRYSLELSLVTAFRCLPLPSSILMRCLPPY